MLLAGVYKPAGEAQNFPGTFRLKAYGPGGRYLITGNPNPDCNGIYTYTGEHNGFPYCTLAGGAFLIWKHIVAPAYVISIALDVTAPGYWIHPVHWGIPGPYAPGGTYTGDPDAAVNAVSILRLRIHGRRGGSGCAPGDWHGTPAQAKVRVDFTNRMKEYGDAPPEPEVWVQGNPIPDITGWYLYFGQINANNAFYDQVSGFYVWWHQGILRWLVSDDPPNLPGPADFWWKNPLPDWVGLYAPQGMSVNDLNVVDEP